MSANDVFQEVPALARIALSAYVRTADWALRAVLAALGVDLGGYRPAAASPPPAGESNPATRDSIRPEAAGRELTLRQRGEELLRRSADVREDEDDHPAYARILDELLPDEARVLRLLFIGGPQPAVDVRAGVLPMNATSELIAPGLTMIGAEAGCRKVERIPAYLNNLYRLGLVWFSREPVGERMRYQVLEAQPDVVEALRAKGRGRTVRRSIALTPFGKDFCDRVLPPTTAEFDALPTQEPVHEA